MPPKSWANPMRKRSGYKQYDFKIDDREYILEVPDGVTTQIVQNHTKEKRELYEKIASLAIEKGYEVDKDTPPKPLVNKEKSSPMNSLIMLTEAIIIITKPNRIPYGKPTDDINRKIF